MSRSHLLQAAAILLTLSIMYAPKPVHADLVTVSNHGFEDLSGQSVFNEFTFGTPTGWNLYDPNGIVPSAGVFTGTLLPNGTDFFNTTAPEGTRVALLFNSSREGDGEYGFEQTLGETLQANMSYTLSVEVGNIASGFATNGTFFNLDEFPGYRVDLLAGGQVIASDNNLLNIAEGEFETSTIQFQTAASHAFLGQNLGIRLVNLNNIPSGFTAATSPDLEVDFDNVLLEASSLAVPEPSSFVVVLCGLATIGLRRNRS